MIYDSIVAIKSSVLSASCKIWLVHQCMFLVFVRMYVYLVSSVSLHMHGLIGIPIVSSVSSVPI